MTDRELWLLLGAHAKQVNGLLQELSKRGKCVRVESNKSYQGISLMYQINVGELN